MPLFGSVEKNYLTNIIASGRKTWDGLVDMRFYDWSSAPHNPITCPVYYEDRLVKVDFSNSKADEGFEVVEAVFEECIFDKSIWWLMVFSKCKFIKCSFNNCRLYNSKFYGKFYDCSFKNFTTKGERFSFGWGSEYNNCNFESVNIRNIPDMVGTRFVDCKISGSITNTFESVLHGKKFALKKRFCSVSNLFDYKYRPVEFVHCDLSELKIQNVVFEKDIIFKNNKVGTQSFFE